MEDARRRGLYNIRFDPPVPKDRVYDVVGRRAGVIVFRDSPLYRHGVSPNKIFDYIAAARPVLLACNAEWNIVDIANAGVTVAPEDAAARPTACAGCTSSARRSGRRWADGGEYIEGHHSTRHLGDQLECVLAGLSAEKS